MPAANAWACCEPHEQIAFALAVLKAIVAPAGGEAEHMFAEDQADERRSGIRRG